MMPFNGYQLYRAERPMSAAEQRDCDARRGARVAALARFGAGLVRAAGRARRTVTRPSPVVVGCCEMTEGL